MEHYFTAQRDNIFRNVEVLIYVFDVESREIDKDIHYYQSCLESMAQHSPKAKIFCLVHKMDLVPDNQREAVSIRFSLFRVKVTRTSQSFKMASFVSFRFTTSESRNWKPTRSH